MSKGTYLIDKEGIPSIDEMKSFFQNHDFTSMVVDFNAELADESDVLLYKKVEELFSCAWDRSLDTKTCWGNYSEDHPVIKLKEADKKVIAGAVVRVAQQEERLESFVETGLNIALNRIDNECEKYFKEHQIIEDELTLEKSDVLWGKVSDVILEDAVKLLQQVQSVPEILAVCGEYKTHEDYAQKQRNWDQIDFYRHWNHSQTSVGAMRSLDEIDERLQADISAKHEIERVVDNLAYEQLRDAFCAILDDVDKQIVLMRETGCSQAQIAEKMGFVSQSAVSKRLKKLEDKFLMFLTESF